MKKRPLAPCLFACLLATLAAPPIASAADQADVLPQATTASILFSRSTSWPDDTLRTATIYRIRPSGGLITQLTPKTDDIYYLGGSWSPSGSSIVYEKLKLATSDRSQLFTIDRNGGSLHRITSGLARHGSAVWGPGAKIAFITQYGSQSCLSTVRGDGTNQRDLYCTLREMATPQWSANGKNLFLHVDYFGSGLDPQWHSRAYRVNASTGALTLLTAQTMDDPRYLEFAPDGSRGIYYDLNETTTSMMQIDFASDTLTSLGDGFLPRYSKDGSQIAFSRTTYGGPPDFPVYTMLYTMHADGSFVVERTHDHLDGVQYAVDDWSRDGSRILVGRNGSLRILDVATESQTPVTNGYAGRGAWYQH